MAKKKHRKLFPLLAKDTNKTLDCSLGICDPICPYNCYQEPNYSAATPRLSPWSSPHPIKPPSPSILAVYQPPQSPSSSIDSITIITVTGVVIVILLTGFFLAAKYVTESLNRSNQDSQRHHNSTDLDDEETREEDFQEEVDHPIWLIRTTGLQQSVINSITICYYKRGEGLVDRTDCPVCLNEFEEDECLRLLPKCNHAFHVSCIDTWLGSHTNCPLCRASIAISAVTPHCSGPVDVITRGESDSPGLDDNGVGEAYADNRTETEEKVEIFEECIDSLRRNSIDSFLLAKTHVESDDFAGKSCEDQNQGFTEKQSRDIGEEASCSEENDGGYNVGSVIISSDLIGSCESNGEENEVMEKIGSDISSNTFKAIESSSSSSVSCFNKNKSSVFPM
ncbi:unnamed protein product [Cochlearia groenlandica]